MKNFNIGKESIYSFEWNLIDSNMYLIYREGLALIVDPIYTEETKKFLFKPKSAKLKHKINCIVV